jgi:hypothetical protein
MKPFTIIGSAAAFLGAVVTLHAQTRPLGSSAGNLLQVGQALMMYANDNKGHLPPDLGKLAKYVRGNLDVFTSPRGGTPLPREVREKPEASADWFNSRCDYVLTVPPGTRLSRVREPGAFPLVIEKGSKGREPIAILYADGHVVEYAAATAPPTIARDEQPTASRPGAMTPATPATLPADVAAVAGKFPADLPAALVGAWRLTAGVDATYQFDADGTFTLRFPGAGQAGGTWKLDGKRLVMTNTTSGTPFTLVGEQEDAEIVGVTERALALRTTNRKGAEEVLVFQKIVPFPKGKHDNKMIVGTWQADNLLLVLGESGLLVMSGGPRNMKGQWSQAGDMLTVLFDVPAAGQRRIDREPTTRETSFTIDLVNDTTLILTGPFLQRAEGPVAFLRVK